MPKLGSSSQLQQVRGENETGKVCWECSIYSKVSKNLSEVKSFSSFNFNDVALDESFEDIPLELVIYSYRYSDPFNLERKEVLEQKKENEVNLSS